MRVETLSDHPGDMLADAVRDRGRGAAEQEARVEGARRDRDQARSAGRWLRWLRLAFVVSHEKRELARLRMSSQFPTNKEASIQAGHDAERRVAEELGGLLGDDWVLFRGYRNRRGEIDGLLVGPRGLFAYEVKYHNATVYIRGDDWWSEKFDRYGNSVGASAPMADTRGRSPATQLSEPVAALSDWLRRRGQQVAVTPVVLLTHDRARVGSSQSPTVRVETSVQGVLRLIGRSSVTLDARRRAVVEQIIRDDHRHHEQRLSRPGRAHN
jgi:nuclease-like protein